MKRKVIIAMMVMSLAIVLTGCMGRRNNQNQPAKEDTQQENQSNTNGNQTDGTDGVNSGTPTDDAVNDIPEQEMNGNGGDIRENHAGNTQNGEKNIIEEVGDGVGNVIEDAGDAVQDVGDGVGNAVKDMTN